MNVGVIFFSQPVVPNLFRHPISIKNLTFNNPMAALQLHYTEDEFNKLLNQQITPADFLQQVMKHEGDEPANPGNKPLVIAQLVSYHNHTGAAPQIEDFELLDATWDAATLSGKVKIKYTVQRFYGCSDVNTAENDHETWSYQMDTHRKCVVVNAPDFERLSPGDEF